VPPSPEAKSGNAVPTMAAAHISDSANEIKRTLASFFESFITLVLGFACGLKSNPF
jgi:hypothetical protein